MLRAMKILMNNKLHPQLMLSIRIFLLRQVTTYSILSGAICNLLTVITFCMVVSGGIHSGVEEIALQEEPLIISRPSSVARNSMPTEEIALQKEQFIMSRTPAVARKQKT